MRVSVAVGIAALSMCAACNKEPVRTAVAPACATCHQEIARSYAGVAMSQSMRALSDRIENEPPEGRLDHARSGRRYEVIRRDGRLIQRRQEIGGENAFELTVTHVIGSGRHARTYFHRTSAGELIQLPLSWYPEANGWRLSPGFDTAVPPDFTRRADESCLFCHNGYPRRDGSLAQGIDCERCHGDGSSHATLAAKGASKEAVRAAIVHPGRLSPDRQMDVCMQCHLETTSVELPQTIRRFGREVFSYRPGEPLGDYMIYLDAASGRDRFEIVNQAYRLRQSACFLQSEGRMTCVACHNPHRTPHGEEAIALQRKQCLGCHPSPAKANHPDPAGADCARCHMPKRRTEDAVHVIMTDHRIVRRPPPNPTAPREEKARQFPGALLIYYPDLDAHERDLYVGVALISGGRDRKRGIALLQSSANPKALAVAAEGRLSEGDTAGAIRDFEQAIAKGAVTARTHYNYAQALTASSRFAEAKTRYEEAIRMLNPFPEAHYGLANALARTGDLSAAAASYEAAIAMRPVYAEAHNNLGNVLASQGKAGEARAKFEQALRIDPALAEAHENLARVLALEGRAAEATAHARRAVALKPESATAHYNLGQLLQAGGAAEPAIEEFRKAIGSKPDFVEAHLALGAALADGGRMNAAIAEFRRVLALRPDHAKAKKFLELAAGMR